MQVGNREAQRFEEIDIIVDTGSTYTAVPRAMLERLGVPVQWSMPSQTADGRIVPVNIGQTIVRLEGIEFYTPVIFAEDNEPSLLGAVTPEEAGLAVVTVNGRPHSYNSSPGFQYPIHGFSFHRGSPHTRAAPM